MNINKHTLGGNKTQAYMIEGMIEMGSGERALKTLVLWLPWTG